MIKEYRNALKAIRAELAQIYATFPITEGQRIERRRLANLQLVIEDELRRLYEKNRPFLIERLSDLYKDSYYMTGWAVEMELSGVQLTWGLLSPEVVRQAVLAPIDKLTLNDRLERNRRKIIAEIKHQLTQGLIKGDSYEDMARRMKKVLEQDARKSRTIARTEGHRIVETGRFNSVQEAIDFGIEMEKVWDATLDRRTRPAHRALDGRTIEVEEYFKSMNGGYGPHPGDMRSARDDIRCRCIARYQVKGYPPSVRHSMDGLIKYQTYDQWANDRGYSS